MSVSELRMSRGRGAALRRTAFAAAWALRAASASVVSSAATPAQQADRPPAAEETPAVAPAVDVVSFRTANDQVHVPVTIGGKGPFWFIVDTGSSVGGIVDRSVAQTLDLEVVAEVRVGDGSGRADETLPVAVARNVVVGGTSLGTLDVLVDDFRRPMGGVDERLGLLGLAAFRRVTLVVDYPGGTVELVPGPVLTEASEHDVDLPADFDVTRELVVPLRVGAHELRAVIDTGSASGLNLPIAALDHVATVGEPRVRGRARTRTNEYEILEAVLEDPVELAGHRLAPATVRFNGHHDVAIVGHGVLRRMRLTLDPFRRRLRLELPPEAPPEPQPRKERR